MSDRARMLKRRIGAVLLLCVWCASGYAADPPFFWTVQGPGVQHVLMGSVHLLPKSAYPLHPDIDRAYAEASTLILETDLDAVSAPSAQKRMLAAARGTRPLREELGPALYERLQVRLRTLDLSARLCDGFKPWFCSLTMSLLAFQKIGMTPDRGVDVHFFGRAQDDEKPMRWLESAERQMELFAGMDEAMSRSFLVSAIEELEDPQRGPRMLIDAWLNNDVGAIADMVAQMQTDHPELYERLLVQRNREWMPQLEALLRSKQPQMVLVGAAHLVGADGLVTQLAERGFELRQRVSEPAPAGEAIPSPVP